MMLGWRPPSFDIRNEEFRNLVRRSREVVLLAAITGSITGLMVRFFEYVVVDISFDRIIQGPLWVGAVAPGVGLALGSDPPAYRGQRRLVRNVRRVSPGVPRPRVSDAASGVHRPDGGGRDHARHGWPDGARGSVDVRRVRTRRLHPASPARSVPRCGPSHVARGRRRRRCGGDLQGARDRARSSHWRCRSGIRWHAACCSLRSSPVHRATWCSLR